jgi:hypothetical protein
MRLDEKNAATLHAPMPLFVGPAELTLSPNKLRGAEPTVLLTIRHHRSNVSCHLLLTAALRLAASLIVAAYEADALVPIASFPDTIDSDCRPGEEAQ